MTRFVGCIDLHNGKVKQIVGGTLSANESNLHTNFVSTHPSSHFALLYKKHRLERSHLIKLGPGCDEAAKEALRAWPKALQIGGGINLENAKFWLEMGASKVIVTSFLFPNGELDRQRLLALEKQVGKENLVIDLSCRKVGSGWVVAMDRWQTLTQFQLSKESLAELEQHCSEFLVHAADVEGLCKGIDVELVERLGEWSSVPVVYAGGGRGLEDLDLVRRLSGGRVDVAFGSALDIFGGSGLKFEDAVQWNDRYS